jgi:hypothetical protein
LFARGDEEISPQKILKYLRRKTTKNETTYFISSRCWEASARLNLLSCYVFETAKP